MLISVTRTLLLYIVIITLMRLMGKRQIGDLQTSELVVTLLISDIASMPMENTGKPLLSGFVPILVLVSCEIVMSVIMLKRSNFRRIVCGKPVIVIKDGEIDQQAMARLRFSTEDLYEQLRLGEVFNIKDVAYAIIETNGSMSIMKKPQNDTPTREDMNIDVKYEGIEVVVVSDGEFAPSSCKVYGISREKVERELRKKSTEMKDVYIMTANALGKFNIIRKEGKK